MSDALVFCQLRPEHEAALAAFFSDLSVAGDDRFFHPHPFTAEEAHLIATYPGRDLYCAALTAGRVMAYGLLRGWDQGYNVPSLGIAVHPDARGTGLARAFMLYLHATAQQRGAPRIRLKVYPTNVAARRLYESLGYVFNEPAGDAQLVGLLELPRSSRAA